MGICIVQTLEIPRLTTHMSSGSPHLNCKSENYKHLHYKKTMGRMKSVSNRANLDWRSWKINLKHWCLQAGLNDRWGNWRGKKVSQAEEVCEPGGKCGCVRSEEWWWLYGLIVKTWVKVNWNSDWAIGLGFNTTCLIRTNLATFMKNLNLI